MNRNAPSSWFDLPPDAATFEPVSQEFAFVRLWRGFMTARAMIAGLLLIMQVFNSMIGQAVNPWMIALCVAYFVATVVVRFFARPSPPGLTFDPHWVSTIGVDLVAFSALQFLQLGPLNYTPLFALPVLVAAVLGSLLLALATAAAVTLLQLSEAWWFSLQVGSDAAAGMMQAGLGGIGFFILALMVNQLSSRLAREELTARRSLLAARMQIQVNELVIETLTDGVLVIDNNGIVRAANPAARRLLSPDDSSRRAPFVLAAEKSWMPLVELAQQTFIQRQACRADVLLESAGPSGHSMQRVHVRTRLTEGYGSGEENLCVMFVEDLREMEARIRTEKLAAMGRMSAAVAHEIRNPLAAIMQANSLLEEDLSTPAHRQLTRMVGQNTLRLSRIVEDVLDVSRVQSRAADPNAPGIDLAQTVRVICADWSRQNDCAARLLVALHEPGALAVFDEDHLRRVLINLLDNALRHAEQADGAIEVSTTSGQGEPLQLRVWSRGPMIERTVQARLFEPFFSSDSRSSGLGLYICRELCMRHDASIGYQRTQRRGLEGNEFFVTLRAQPQPDAAPGPVLTHVQMTLT
jgi:two-component system sensor histidine kinase PilS (NtrC family)